MVIRPIVREGKQENRSKVPFLEGPCYEKRDLATLCSGLLKKLVAHSINKTPHLNMLQHQRVKELNPIQFAISSHRRS